MIKYRLFLLCFLILILFKPVVAQDIKAKVEKRSIGDGDFLKIVLVFPKDLKKEYLKFPPTAFPEFQDFLKVKTEYTRDDKEDKTFEVIQYYQALKAGKFWLEPFSIMAGAHKISFAGSAVYVKPAALQSQIAYPTEQDLKFDTEKPDFKLVVRSDKKSIYQGESFSVTADLLFRKDKKAYWNIKNYRDQGAEISRKIIPMNCAIDESSGIIQNPVIDSTIYNNTTYYRIRIFEGKFYPQVPGEIKLPETYYTIYYYRTASSIRTLWWKAEELELKSTPQIIEVQSLPSHPRRETVPVGSFQLKEQISAGKVITGKNFHYKAIITGNGNPSYVHSPRFDEIEPFEIYLPSGANKVVHDGKNFTGKVFEYDIIPKEPGVYHLNKYFYWVYFDPERKVYDTLSSKYVITVSGESQKNKEIFSSYIGSFYELANKESNTLKSKEKDQSIKFFANIIILFMLVTTAILVFKR